MFAPDDIRVRICSVFLVDSIREKTMLRESRLARFGELGLLGETVLEGALDVIELSWRESVNDNEVEFHFWASGVLLEFASQTCEERILNRLKTATEVEARKCLVDSIGVFAHSTFVNGLHERTVRECLRIASDPTECDIARQAAKEVLVDDILQADCNRPFLSSKDRDSIEGMRGE